MNEYLDTIAKLKEESRIKFLSDEREIGQSEIFSRWINVVITEASHLLNKIDLRALTPNLSRRFIPASIATKSTCVKDIFQDLRDGVILTILIEILSGKSLPRPTRSPLRIHLLENVAMVLDHLMCEEGVHLENIGPQDIVDGNRRLTLGLIWSIILHFEIGSVTVDQPSAPGGHFTSAKAALLLWCQLKTADYAQVRVTNFTSSWLNGLAFCALLHKHRPDLIDYQSMVLFAGPIQRLELAFTQAELHLGIPRLVDSRELIDLWWKDEKTMITLIVTWYHWMNENHKRNKIHSKLSRLLGLLVSVDKILVNYKINSAKWFIKIQRNQSELKSRMNSFALNDLDSPVYDHFRWMIDWRNEQKKSLSNDRNRMEFDAFIVRILQLKDGLNFIRIPPNFSPSIFDRAWFDLSTIEHDFAQTIFKELGRLANVSKLKNHFGRKAMLFTSWLEDNERILDDCNEADGEALEMELELLRAAADRVETLDEQGLHFRSRVSGAIMKHCAFETDSQNYATLRLDSLKQLYGKLQTKLSDEFLTHEAEGLRALCERWHKFKAKLELRGRKLAVLESSYCIVLEFMGFNGELSRRNAETQQFYKNVYEMPEHRVHKISAELRTAQHAVTQLRKQHDHIEASIRQLYPQFWLSIHSLFLDLIAHFEQLDHKLGTLMEIMHQKIKLNQQIDELLAEVNQEILWTK
ncbi:Spectrin beta chain, non-erythrocytic 1, partial [Cichlidogyrus casuarinus]